MQVFIKRFDVENLCHLGIHKDFLKDPSLCRSSSDRRIYAARSLLRFGTDGRYRLIAAGARAAAKQLHVAAAIDWRTE